jgi:hypothetical protein
MYSCNLKWAPRVKPITIWNEGSIFKDRYEIWCRPWALSVMYGASVRTHSGSTWPNAAMATSTLNKHNWTTNMLYSEAYTHKKANYVCKLKHEKCICDNPPNECVVLKKKVLHYKHFFNILSLFCLSACYSICLSAELSLEIVDEESCYVGTDPPVYNITDWILILDRPIFGCLSGK